MSFLPTFEKNIYLLHILNLILKLYVFFNSSYFPCPYDGQNETRFRKINGKEKSFEYNFLIIGKTLYNSELYFIANRKFTSYNNIKIMKRLWKQYTLFSYLHCMKDRQGERAQFVPIGMSMICTKVCPLNSTKC